MNNIIYTVTVLDLYSDPVLGLRRTPVVYTELDDAIFAVKNNLNDLSEGISYQYAVIEETLLNVIRPQIHYTQRHWWFKYNSALDEFVASLPPANLRLQSGFGVG